jgi:hypothetical protein
MLEFFLHCGTGRVLILGKQRPFYRSVNGRMLRASAVPDPKVFFCLDYTCERKLVFRMNRMCVPDISLRGELRKRT